MGDIYRFLGLSVGCNLHDMTTARKKAAYACDITYTTNSELGFDYLRDHMVHNLSDEVQRKLHYALVDEVDSILIDEARTPLIISGPGPSLADQYLQADKFAKSLSKDDYVIDEEDRSISLTDAGIHKADAFYSVVNIYDGEHPEMVHDVQNALRANYIMKKDVEYVVGDDEIILVDAFTGRKMEGREFSDGLHQAIQAKEGVGIKQETMTLATITYQNLFRLYDSLSGMSGTAKSEEEEFLDTYNMRCYEVPTNKPVIRKDEPDEIFVTRHEKYEKLIEDVLKIHETGQPVLIGTVSVAVNELISGMLKEKGIGHEVLNARNDADEAGIIARAGQKGAVTVATNMAGRGTDIQLGEGVDKLGGLAVLGSERHEAKRIDDQLRGRSGRQGDPGLSRFYVSMEDDLITQYATEEAKASIAAWCKKHGNVDKMRELVDRIQERAVGLHYDARKRTLSFDNVLMQQRNAVYSMRDQVLGMENIHSLIEKLLVEDLKESEALPKADLKEHLHMYHIDLKEGEKKRTFVEDTMKEALARYTEQNENTDPIIKDFTEKEIFLHVLDTAWQHHVDVMEHLKQSILLRGYASKKPEEAYTEEGFERYENMMRNVREVTLLNLWAMKLPKVEQEAEAEKEVPAQAE